MIFTENNVIKGEITFAQSKIMKQPTVLRGFSYKYSYFNRTCRKQIHVYHALRRMRPHWWLDVSIQYDFRP